MTDINVIYKNIYEIYKKTPPSVNEATIKE